MTEQFIPTTQQVREAYKTAHVEVGASYDPAEFDRWLAKRDGEVAAKVLEAFAENLNLHTNIPDEWDTELIFPLCGDDECLFWDMTYDLAETLRARATEYRKAANYPPSDSYGSVLNNREESHD